MKLYLAGYTTWAKTFSLLPKNIIEKLNFLESYLVFWNKKPIQDYNLYWKTFFLDSWAFTAFTQWKDINIDDYIKHLQEYWEYYHNIVNLDVIWNWEKTLNNQRYMESKGLKPMPTYHLWSPVHFFEKYVKEYDYIWLWWMVPYSTQPKKIISFLDYCFNYIKKNNLKTKIHWRWMTNPKIMKRYPFYSVDSTWRLAGWKFKTIMKYQNWKLISKSAAKIRKEQWIDFWVKHYYELNNINIVELYKYVDYVTELQRSKWMMYWDE